MPEYQNYESRYDEQSSERTKPWRSIPGGEPENFGDEASGQAVDAGLRWCATQSSIRPAQV